MPTHISTNVAAGGDTVDEHDRRRYFLRTRSRFGRDSSSLASIQVLSFLYPPFIKTLRTMFGLSVGEGLYPFHLSLFSLIYCFLVYLSVLSILSNHCMCCRVFIRDFQLLLNFPKILTSNQNFLFDAWRTHSESI